MDAGRELDALVAEKVMGLTVVAQDWPCGLDFDGCTDEAWSWPEEPPPTHFTPQPIYVDSRSTWPAIRSDPLFVGDTMNVYVYAFPVPRYSTDIAAAWQVIRTLQTRSIWVRELKNPDNDMWECQFVCYTRDPEAFGVDRFYSGCVEGAPHAICLAALRAVGVEV